MQQDLQNKPSLWATYFPLTIWFLGSLYLILMAYSTPFEYDCSVHAGLIRNLIENHLYADYDDKLIFNPKFSTGYPLILPTYLIAKFFILDDFILKIPALLYSIFSFFVGYKVLSLYLPAKHFVLKTVILLICLLYLTAYISVLILGESCAIFWLLLGLYFIAKERPSWFWTGICLGLAVTTKYITGLILVVFLGFLITLCIINYKEKLMRWWQPFVLSIGVCVPFLLFELYKLLTLGTKQYGDSWIAFRNSLFTHYMPQTQKLTFIDILQKHCDVIGLPAIMTKIGLPVSMAPWLLLGFLLAIIGCVGSLFKLQYIKKQKPTLKTIALLSFIFAGASWIVYQSISTDLFWYRRLVPFYFILVFSSLTMMFYIKNKGRYIYMFFLFICGFQVFNLNSSTSFADTHKQNKEYHGFLWDLNNKFADKKIYYQRGVFSFSWGIKKDLGYYSSLHTVWSELTATHTSGYLLYSTRRLRQESILRYFDTKEVLKYDEYKLCEVTPKPLQNAPEPTALVQTLLGKEFFVHGPRTLENSSSVIMYAKKTTASLTLEQDIKKLIVDCSAQEDKTSTSLSISFKGPAYKKTKTVLFPTHEFIPIEIDLPKGKYEVTVENYYGGKTRPWVYINALYFCR
ncbi:MAG: hypothetical protein PHX74_10015 [Candidatus Sumerlaeales bacterium]|nr:hypothetical protein [Candidatus Sumerlaeales bacterium]